MLLKDLFDDKREYFESERQLGEEMNNFIREVVRRTNPTVDSKNYYIKIEFKEVGKYSHDEIVITSVSDYLTDEVIGALVREYNLKVTYKCVQTGFNIEEQEVNMQSRVFFRHIGESEVLELDEDLEEETVVDEEDTSEDND